jgi:hypothetical protein
VRQIEAAVPHVVLVGPVQFSVLKFGSGVLVAVARGWP